MAFPAAVSPAQKDHTSLSTALTRLWEAHTLRLARIAWVVAVAGTLTLVAMAVPVRYAHLQRTIQNLTPAQELVLKDVLAVFGQDIASHLRIVVAIEVLVILAFTVIAGLIIFRRRDGVALHLSAALVAFSAWMSPLLTTLAINVPMWERTVYVIEAVGFCLAISTLYTFPTGRFTPRWTRYFFLGVIASAVLWVLVPASPFNLSKPYQLSLLSFGIIEFWWISGIVAQVWRFARVATPIERQQTKWVLFGFAVGTSLYIALLVERVVVPVFGESRFSNFIYDLFGVPLFLPVLLIAPATFAISIFRYRLFEIELVIRRTLVYTTLTAILAGLYIASVGFFQRLFVAVTGERSEGAIVLTTLVVAAAFTPVKNGLQSFVDKHVKDVPDPTKPLRTFGDTVKGFADLLDPQQLCHRMVQETVAAFGATYGAIYLLKEGELELSCDSGDAQVVSVTSVPLEYDGRPLGEVRLGPRHDGAGYNERDLQTLSNICAQVARTLHFLEGAGAVLTPAPRREEQAAAVPASV